MIRTIPISGERYDRMLVDRRLRVTIKSFFPVDPYTCECQPQIEALKRQLAVLPEAQRVDKMIEMRSLVCPRDKTGFTKFKITCKNCGEVQGTLWAKDRFLTDWFDFHYLQWHDRQEWHGCFTPHVSPVDGKLCLECTCGQDTRDFRANMTMAYKISSRMEAENSVGREFNRVNSKFLVEIA